MKNQSTVTAALELDGRTTPLWHQSTRCPASLAPVLQPHRPLHCSRSVWEAKPLPPTGSAPAVPQACRALPHVCARLRFLIHYPGQLSPLKMPSLGNPSLSLSVPSSSFLFSVALIIVLPYLVGLLSVSPAGPLSVSLQSIPSA